MATKQISETNLAARLYDVLADLGLSKVPSASENSNVMVTKMRSGANGSVLVCVKASAGTCTLKLKAEADETLDFGSGTVDIAISDTERVWHMLPVNGSTAKYFGLRVDTPAGGLDWEEFLVIEACVIDLDGGENYPLMSAGFMAKKTLATGAIDPAFPA